MEKRMSDKDSAQNVIDAYRKRQQAARKAPLIIGIAALLLIVGAAFLIFWLIGPNKPSIALFATDTPTPTVTSTATATATQTSTPTITPTETPTPTVTLTPTQSGPFTYQVEEGDNLFAIAQRFNVDLLLLITINNLDPANPIIRAGDKLTIPGPDTELPSPTPLPPNLPRGTKIEYQVQPGDSLGSIALAFNTSVDEIKAENEGIENENDIFVGQKLVIPVNTVPTNTPAPATITPTPGGVATIIPPTNTGSPITPTLAITGTATTP